MLNSWLAYRCATSPTADVIAVDVPQTLTWTIALISYVVTDDRGDLSRRSRGSSNGVVDQVLSAGVRVDRSLDGVSPVLRSSQVPVPRYRRPTPRPPRHRNRMVVLKIGCLGDEFAVDIDAVEGRR